PGKNKGGDCDTKARYIYLHGVPDTYAMGIPESHGCVRMRNDDIIALYPYVPIGTYVEIQE
ncbi:MAG: L,D-transpeptidase, partial [Pseudomonadota bacterium]